MRIQKIWRVGRVEEVPFLVPCGAGSTPSLENPGTHDGSFTVYFDKGMCGVVCEGPKKAEVTCRTETFATSLPAREHYGMTETVGVKETVVMGW